jgi:hypothetical protein
MWRGLELGDSPAQVRSWHCLRPAAVLASPFTCSIPSLSSTSRLLPLAPQADSWLGVAPLTPHPLADPRIIWTAAVLGVQSYVTQEPLRAPKDANSPLATLG